MLQKEHLEDLLKSGLTEQTILDLGFKSVNQEELEKELKFKLPTTTNYSGIEIPYQNDFKRYKLFPSVSFEDGSSRKYLQAKESGTHIYLPQIYRERFLKSKVRYITEGEKKGAKANQEGYPTLSLGGIWNWKTKESLQPVPELLKIDWLFKEAVLIPDSDFRYKQGVLLAVFRLGKELEKLGAKVSVLCLPMSDSGDKSGLDDYLVSGNKLENIETISLKHPIFKANACKEGKEKKQQTPRSPHSNKGLSIYEGDSAKAIGILKSLGYEFRYNSVKNVLEYKNKETNWGKLETREYNDLFLFVRQIEKISDETFYKLLNSNYVSERFDTFKNFFSKTKWDEEDHIDSLFQTLNLKSNEDLPRESVYLKKWLITSVGCMLGEIPNETCLVLNGPQGHYKTKWFKTLFEKVPEFSDYQTTSKSLDSSSADSMRLLVQNGLIILDELEALNRTEVDEIKLIFSKTEISVRLPYDRDFSNLIRRASFAGTTNNPVFLKDPTGSRRWLVIDVHDPIDFEALNKINYPQVWAQAHHLYKEGERYWFDHAETKSLNEENEKYYFAPIADELLDNCKPLDDYEAESPENWKTATQIATLLLEGKVPTTDKFIQQVGHALRKKGYIRKSIDRTYKWNATLKARRLI